MRRHDGPSGGELLRHQIILANVEVSPLELRTTSLFCLNIPIVLVVVLFKTFSFSALSMLKVIILPSIFQVPRIVPVMPWPRVLLINPWGRTWEMNLPSALNEIVSFMSPTVPRQFPTIVAAYCASPMVAPSGAQDDRLNANITSRLKRSIFIEIPLGATLLQSHYHFIDSGVDNVFLEKGYHLKRSPRGGSVSIEN